MYDRVKQWVFHEGGRLLYLGGNGLNCEVEIQGSSMWVHNGQITGLDVAGIGGESRFALRHESEANLLGVVFTPPGAMTGAPYRVVDAEPLDLRSHRPRRKATCSAGSPCTGDAPAVRPGTRRTSSRPARPRMRGCWPRG